jgi:hypothetical protein
MSSREFSPVKVPKWCRAERMCGREAQPMRVNGKRRGIRGPMNDCRAWRRVGERIMTRLRLHFDEAPEDVIPFPRPIPPAYPRLAPVGDEGVIDPVRMAERALDRMERQLRNLRALMGEGFPPPDAPRAA